MCMSQIGGYHLEGIISSGRVTLAHSILARKSVPTMSTCQPLPACMHACLLCLLACAGCRFSKSFRVTVPVTAMVLSSPPSSARPSMETLAGLALEHGMRKSKNFNSDVPFAFSALSQLQLQTVCSCDSYQPLPTRRGWDAARSVCRRPICLCDAPHRLHFVPPPCHFKCSCVVCADGRKSSQILM